MPEQFNVTLEKEQLIFSAAHFITFAGNICESIHGHNYRVRCEVTGELDENGYVVDFIALRDALNTIVRQLDHKVLLPRDSSLIHVSSNDQEVIVQFEQKRWIFPEDNCMILPVTNTTAELLAKFIAQELMKLDDPRLQNAIDEILVAVDENEGQWGTYRVPWSTAS